MSRKRAAFVSALVSNGRIVPPLTSQPKRREHLLKDGGLFLDGLIARYKAEQVLPATDALRTLTRLHIAPHAADIVRDMFELRAETDVFFLKRLEGEGRAGAMPSADEGMPVASYPVSYCLEITRHMLMLMSREPAPPRMTGLAAMHDFVRAGGSVRRVWGALRGGYFQNAIQVGTYYLDVANDTVNPAKPKIEFLPLAEANFNNVGSYFEFARVGQGYWQCRTIPNRYFPNLAPFYPAITFGKDGAVRFDSRNSFMFPMNIAKRFGPARDFVMGDDLDETALDPYLDWLARYAARDERTSDRHHPMWFRKVAHAELDAAFRTAVAQDADATAQSVSRALDPDIRFLDFPDMAGETLPHMQPAEA